MSKRPFDQVATRYDSDFTHTLTGRLQRKAVQRYLEPFLLQKTCKVLELNCGTGEDAAWIAQYGHSVLATDISQGMVDVARLKTAAYPRVQVQRASIQEALDLEGGPWDLIFSDFGGLNCLSPAEMAALGPKIKASLQPQGRFIAVIMPRGCVWEALYFMAKLRPGKASRRWGGGPLEAPLQDGSMQRTWYYGPGRLRKMWAPALREVRQMGVGLYLPPSYLEPWAVRHPEWMEKLARWERNSERKEWLAGVSDHFIIEFRAG